MPITTAKTKTSLTRDDFDVAIRREFEQNLPLGYTDAMKEFVADFTNEVTGIQKLRQGNKELFETQGSAAFYRRGGFLLHIKFHHRRKMIGNQWVSNRVCSGDGDRKISKDDVWRSAGSIYFVKSFLRVIGVTVNC